MCATGRVLIPNLGKLFLPKMGGQLDQGGPQPAVDVGNLAVNELTYQDLGALTDGPGDAEDLAAFRVPPPAPSNGAARNGFSKARHRPARSLKHHAVSFNERHPFFRTHATQPCQPARCSPNHRLP